MKNSETSTREKLDIAQWRDVFSQVDTLLTQPADQRRGDDDSALSRQQSECDQKVDSVVRQWARSGPAQTEELGSIVDVVATQSVTATVPIKQMRLGHYRLLERIGQGGMGSVWRAERTDGLYQAQVAIKLLGTLALSAQSRARFAQEGQILARLTHPNIARLLDAGTTEDGQRYLVIELIDGVSITDYVAREKLTVDARLKLFRQLLDAVAFAHERLVIHRDIKPANIVVTANGALKLLDFGVAKLLTADSGEASLTELHGAAYTEAYAAPEQMRDEPPAVAADVFSLGIILFELVTSRRAAWTQPKRALTRGDTPELIETIAPPDLRAIIGKALAVSPDDRYRSVLALDDDLRRLLNRQPVVARPATRAYVLTRFLRRNWVAASTVFGAALALSVFSLLIYRESEMQRRSKEFLLEALTPTSYYADGGGLLTHSEMLNRAAAGVATRFGDEPRVASELYEAIGESLFNLGEHADAYKVRVKAQPVIDAAHGSTSRQAVRNAGRATYLLLTQHHLPQFIESLRDLRERCPSVDSVPVDRCYNYVWMQTQYHAYTGEGQIRHALWQHYDQLVTPTVEAKSRWHTILNYWGAGAARQAGDIKASKARWQKLLALPETQDGARGDHMLALSIAALFNEAGLYREAATLARDAYAQGERWMGPSFDPRLFYVPVVAEAEASADVDFGAEALLRAGIKRSESGSAPNAEIEAAEARSALALTLIAKGRYDEARAPLERALTALRALTPRYNQDVAKLEIWQSALSVLVAPAAEVTAVRRHEVKSLLALRERATAAADASSLPRIDAILAALETDVIIADQYWQNALQAMAVSEARPGDTDVLLRALKSSRRMPPAIRDSTIDAMQSYAQKVLTVTDRALAERAAKTDVQRR